RLSPRGERYWKAKFVLEDTAEARDALADILKEHAVVSNCQMLWMRSGQAAAPSSMIGSSSWG
ncbi:MAG: hypothetical protein ACRDGL_00680, partial [Candidatus Limnocylindrales bacterium]